MQNFYEILPEKQNTAIALGFFDGIHKGHRSVLLPAISEKKNGLTAVCFTFSENPKAILGNQKSYALMTEADKIKALEKLGFDHLYQVDFKKIMNMSATEFVVEILINTLKAKKLFCGFNYRFGKNGEGDVELLKKLCDENGVELTVEPPEQIGNTVISSTLIRNLISNGDVKSANELLYTKFGFCSVIKHGQKLGRELGTPTINQPLCPSLVVPKFGVYASAVTLENGKTYCGVTNIGTKPTVGNYVALSETWMPEYTGDDIYGQKADIRLLEFIRPEKKFADIFQLKEAIIENSKLALEIFKSAYN